MLGPQAVGSWRLVGLLGEGGMGCVYRGVDEAGHEAAVKVLAPELAADAYYQRRFLREAKMLAAVRDPYVVAARGFGVDQGRLFLAMELMPGGTVIDHADDQGGALPVAEAAALARDAAEGVQALHAAGVLHRDLNPANLLRDGRGRAKVCDLSIARPLRTSRHLTAAGATVGTPGYMAPEQARARTDLDVRADVYSLAATLYRLLTGRTAFGDAPAQRMLERAAHEPLPDPRALRADCPEALAAVVLRAGALARDDRHGSAAELAAAIVAAVPAAAALPPAPGAAPATASGDPDTDRLLVGGPSRSSPLATAIAALDDGDADAWSLAARAAEAWLQTNAGDASVRAALARAALRLAWALETWPQPRGASRRALRLALTALDAPAAGAVLPVAGRAALVVDPDPVARRVAVQALRAVGLHADDAADGGGALAAVDRRDYALVLIDAAVDGAAAIARRARRAYPQPVVLTTLAADGHDPGPEAGQDAIAKPFHGLELGARALAALALVGS